MTLPIDNTSHDLGDGHLLRELRLPDELSWDAEKFNAAWQLRPSAPHYAMMFGKPTPLPRGQQAYGASYRYTGSTNQALSIPRWLVPLLTWTQQHVEVQANGLLLNWYNGPAEYIGPHHDDTRDLIPATPIVTISFGVTRTFRLTKWKGKKRVGQLFDVTASAGSVFVMPWETNLAWKHEIVSPAKHHGRRISVTLRAFAKGLLPPEEYFEKL